MIYGGFLGHCRKCLDVQSREYIADGLIWGQRQWQGQEELDKAAEQVGVG